jgi:Domain of unknown function (DUF397)
MAASVLTSRWRKASRSQVNGNCLEAMFRRSSYCASGECLEAAWRKSGHSHANGNCAEAALRDSVVLVRDSRDKDGPVLAFSPADWAAFLAEVKGGAYVR